MSPSTIPSELIDAIIDQVALLTPTNNKPGLHSTVSTLSSCSLVSSAFVFRSQKHIFHTIDLDSRKPRAIYYLRFHRLLASNPHLGTHVRHLRLVDDSMDDLPSGSSWITYMKTPLSRTLSFLPNLYSFGLNFNSCGANWGEVPDDTRAAFERVFKMESMKEVELEFAFGFPVPLLMSLARSKYLALSNVDLDTDLRARDPRSGGKDDFDSKPPCKVTLEGLYLRGVSPGVIKTLTKTLSYADGPRTLRKLALTPTFEEGFTEAVAELITACGSHLTSFAWLPSIHFASSLGPINLAPLHHLRSLYVNISFRNLPSRKPFAQALSLLLQISTRPKSNNLEKITLECHCFTFPYTATAAADSKKFLAKIWRPLDTALCATKSDSEYGLEPIFGNLKEVEIVLSASTTSQPVVHRLMVEKGELLPSVEARGVTLTVKVEKGGEERGLLDRLRQM